MRFIGNSLRPRTEFNRALEGIDTVVHAAALKRVPAAEYGNPSSISRRMSWSTPISPESCSQGARILRTSQRYLSDKAAAPGRTHTEPQLCADKLVLAANNVRGHTIAHDLVSCDTALRRAAAARSFLFF